MGAARPAGRGGLQSWTPTLDVTRAVTPLPLNPRRATPYWTFKRHLDGKQYADAARVLVGMRPAGRCGPGGRHRMTISTLLSFRDRVLRAGADARASENFATRWSANSGQPINSRSIRPCFRAMRRPSSRCRCNTAARRPPPCVANGWAIARCPVRMRVRPARGMKKACVPWSCAGPAARPRRPASIYGCRHARFGPRAKAHAAGKSLGRRESHRRSSSRAGFATSLPGGGLQPTLMAVARRSAPRGCRHTATGAVYQAKGFADYWTMPAAAAYQGDDLPGGTSRYRLVLAAA